MSIANTTPEEKNKHIKDVAAAISSMDEFSRNWVLGYMASVDPSTFWIAIEAMKKRSVQQ